MDIYSELRNRLRDIAESKNLMLEKVVITGRNLTVEEAIGKPVRQDFPLQKGDEKLMQATFLGAQGQAFTDQGGYFHGTLNDIINQPLDSNFSKAVFIATLNAVLKYLGLIEKSIHCRDEEPEECASEIIPFIKEKYGTPRVALVGLQPAMLQSLVKAFEVRVLDLNPGTIGTVKSGVTIEDGEAAMRDVLDWCDLIVATGSTISNGTIENYLVENKPTVFFGTTVAGAAYLMGWERYCFCSK